MFNQKYCELISIISQTFLMQWFPSSCLINLKGKWKTWLASRLVTCFAVTCTRRWKLTNRHRKSSISFLVDKLVHRSGVWFSAQQTSANHWKSHLCFCVGRGFVATFSRSKRSSSTWAVKTLGCSAFVGTSTGKKTASWQEKNYTGVLHMLNTSYSKLTVLE